MRVILGIHYGINYENVPPSQSVPHTKMQGQSGNSEAIYSYLLLIYYGQFSELSSIFLFYTLQLHVFFRFN